MLVVGTADSDVEYWYARGQRPVPCSTGGASWIRNERWSFTRSIDDPGAPDARERQLLFWQRWAPVVSWIDTVDGDADGNALFYACDDRAYDVARLPRHGRRDVLRGLGAVEVRRIGFHELARLGYPAWADTRARARALVPPPSAFVEDCRVRARFDCQEAWAAFAGSALVSWMATHRVRDRLELGVVSFDGQARESCARWALVYEITRHALVEDGVARVGWGVSSLEAESRATSRHRQKISLGFAARPVRRRFELHPLLASLHRPWAIDAAGALLSRAPQHRMVRQMRGALSLMRAS